MQTLLIRLPDGTEQTHPLEGEATVGRADGNALILTLGGVSRRHARFFLEGGKVLVEDLGSANGTFVDGERIEGPTELNPRAQVVIGDYELQVSGAAPTRRPGPRKAAASASPGSRPPPGREGRTAQVPAVRAKRATRAMSAVERQPGARPSGSALAARAPKAPPDSGGPSLRGLTGPWANKVYSVVGKVVVGRVPGVQVQLEDESVSRRHAELLGSADGVVVRDLGSANGTLVNGDPLEGERVLQPGDLLQFGVIELVFEEGDAQALAAPTRRSGGGGRGAEGAPGGGRTWLLVAGAAVAAMLVAGVALKLVGGGAGPTFADGGGGAGLPVDPKVEVERLLSECRSFAATDLGTQPNWERARTACEKARELDPINRAVIELIQKVDREQSCQQHYEAGARLMNLLREEEALEEFGKIVKECAAYRIVKPRAREAIEKVKKRAAEDCSSYIKAQQWAQAVPRCERYMNFACQNMPEEQLLPPLGHEIDLSGRCRRKQNCWAPTHPMYRNLLLSRVRLDPEAGPWMCPPTPMFEDDLVLVDPKADVKKAIRQWHKEALLVEAMELYWDGRSAEAVAKLQRLRADRSKAHAHQTADELRRDIASVENLYKVGSSMLKEQDFDRAAQTFRDALGLDAHLLREMAEKKSFYRSAIENDVARQAYDGGKFWADRGDPRRGCRIWKLGFTFSRGNPDLNRAVSFCSGQGKQALDRASACKDLGLVLEFAVDGDTLKERVAEKASEWSCPS